MAQPGSHSGRVYCVGSTTHCTYSKAIGIDKAIETLGAGTPLVVLARYARCKSCDQVGCHVQVFLRPTTPVPAPTRYVNVREARKRLRR